MIKYNIDFGSIEFVRTGDGSYEAKDSENRTMVWVQIYDIYSSLPLNPIHEIKTLPSSLPLETIIEVPFGNSPHRVVKVLGPENYAVWKFTDRPDYRSEDYYDNHDYIIKYMPQDEP